MPSTASPARRRWRLPLALAVVAALALLVVLGWRGTAPLPPTAIPPAADETPADVLAVVQALEATANPDPGRPNGDTRLAEAAGRLLALAEAGEAEAQWRFGWYYLNGWGLERDRCSATLWFERAARQGQAAAQFRLALALLPPNGQGVAADPVAAYVWASRARDQGFAPAQEHFRLFEHDLAPAQRAEAEALLAGFAAADAPPLAIRRYPYIPLLVGVWPRLMEDVMPCRQAEARYDEPLE